MNLVDIFILRSKSNQIKYINQYLPPHLPYIHHRLTALRQSTFLNSIEIPNIYRRKRLGFR